WEISKQDPDYTGNQRFLASGDTPKFPIGKDYRVTVDHNDKEMTVDVDGLELATVTDTETPYQHGSIGLYTEDARVRFTDFDLPACATQPAQLDSKTSSWPRHINCLGRRPSYSSLPHLDCPF